MAYELEKVDVWAGTIEDRPGGLAEKLEALAKAGVNLEFVVARRHGDKPGAGVVFVAPVKGAGPARAAKAAGLSKAEDMFSVRLMGPDKPGLGSTIAGAIAGAGINMGGLSAAALGRKCIVYFRFDSKEDANKAMGVLKKELKI